SYSPSGLLSSISGQSANGTWTFELKDGGPQDVGTLQNWSLTLSTGEPTATSTSTGDFSFMNLAAGTYHIGQVRPIGWRQTLPNAVVPATGLYDITITTGQQLSGYDFGNFADNTPPGVSSGLYDFDASAAAI